MKNKSKNIPVISRVEQRTSKSEGHPEYIILIIFVILMIAAIILTRIIKGC